MSKNHTVRGGERALEHMLQLDDKGLYDTSNALARLIRELFVTENITPEKSILLLERWSKEIGSQIAADGSTTNARGNLVKELVRPEMSLGVFFKVLSWLNKDYVKITVETGNHKDGDLVTASVEIDKLKDYVIQRSVNRTREE